MPVACPIAWATARRLRVRPRSSGGLAGRVRCAGADPYGGGGGLLGVNAHVERARCSSRGLGPGFGVFASALLSAFFLHRNPTGRVVETFKRRSPHLFEAAAGMLQAGAREMAADQVPLPQALQRLWTLFVPGTGSGSPV